MQSTTVEFFIEKVREYPCLWNMNHVAYRDSGKKHVFWERVAKQCGMSNGRVAKIQWKKLRDSHREALRRRKPSSGPAAPFLKPWKYEDKMKFVLTKTDSILLTNELVDTEECYDNSRENMSSDISVSESVLPIHYNDPLYTNQELQEEEEYAEVQPSTSDHSKRMQELQEPKPAKTQEFHEQGYTKRQPHISSNHNIRMQTFDTNHGDGLSKLFESLCQKTRELPRHLQLRVQREVFDSVSRAEEEALSLHPEPITAYSMSPSSSQGFIRACNADIGSPRDVEDIEYETKFDCNIVDNN